MDQDLEGELALIQSSKQRLWRRCEIFNLPVDEDFVLSDHPTLNHFTAYIMKMTGASNQNLVEELHTKTDEPLSGDRHQEDTTTQIISTESPVLNQTKAVGCRRWQVEIEECLGIKESIEFSGTVVVTDDGWGIAEE